MLHYLQNDHYRIGVESKGAELSHFIKLDEQLELIWQGDPAIWPGRAPNLFPIVGSVPGDQYEVNGQTYQLKRHGFARHKEFELVEEHEDKLVFQLKQDEETLAQYPFKFTLLVAYKLSGSKLDTTYLVRNDDSEGLYFSVGGHTGFNVPLYPQEQYTDYFIEFEQEETLSRYLQNERGLLTGDTRRVLEQERVLPLHHDLFQEDAVIFKSPKSSKVQLASHKNPLRIELTFEGFPYLLIWAKANAAPFVCIEPWCGITSTEGDTGKLDEKEGMQYLGPKLVFERTFGIEVL
ncbi:aldose 1-epimerase family protein [Pontibacter beigongshangensis]|uniref:aldose 1-epimerase family protein n=1 Tax=Pontibacter beigongshangensis TaxID=2574733 RepID=UPI00164F803A|nr:aldose 1-epimerase family protein [Pontibacter beigongshangensis]